MIIKKIYFIKTIQDKILDKTVDYKTLVLNLEFPLLWLFYLFLSFLIAATQQISLTRFNHLSSLIIKI